MRNTQNLNPRHRKFLDLYLKTGDIGKSYIGAGYQCSGASACVAGSRLLRKLDKDLGPLEIFEEEGLTVRSVARRLNELINGKNEAVAVRAIGITTKCLGLQKDNLNINSGFQIVITGQNYKDNDYSQPVHEPAKEVIIETVAIRD